MSLSRYDAQVEIARQKTHRVALRRQAAVTTIAMMSLAIIQWGYGETAVGDADGGVQAPNAPSVPAVNVTPTDTSALVTTAAFSGDAGDSHDSTHYELTLASDPTYASPVWDLRTADSLVSYQGSGAGASVPLTTDSVYIIRAEHYGSVSDAWSGFGASTQFTATSGSGAFIFFSDWSTGTGQGNESIMVDGSKAFPWTTAKGEWETDAAIVDSAFWPDGISNSLQILHVGGGSAAGVRITNQLPAWTSGDRAFRVYFKNVLPSDHSTDGTSHAMEDGRGGSNTNWEFNVQQPPNDALWSPSISVGGTCVGCVANDRSYSLAASCKNGNACGIPKDSVYRFEWKQIYHPTADSMAIEVKLYNADGTLRNDTNEWVSFTNNYTTADTVWYSFRNAASLDDLQIGTNGFNGTNSSDPYATWYWAGVAVCTDWCGAYDGTH